MQLHSRICTKEGSLDGSRFLTLISFLRFACYGIGELRSKPFLTNLQHNVGKEKEVRLYHMVIILDACCPYTFIVV